MTCTTLEMTPRRIEPIRRRRLIVAAASACVAPALAHGSTPAAEVEALLRAIYEPLAQAHDIPGLVVGLVRAGRPHFLEAGTTARQGGSAVTRDTVFELGSISKCFTSALAALAHVQGRLDLEQPVGDAVPLLKGAPIGKATPLHLATYTAGGLPLQFPEGVASIEQAFAYLAAFTPSAAPGLVRRYSNPSMGLLGHATAEAMGGDFVELGQRALLAPLGLTSTHIRVPDAQMHRYAWGHDKFQRPIRVNPGVFDAQAYGLKSTASDMLRFLQSLLDPERMPPALRLAMAHTLVPRYRVGPIQQGMGWEMYPSPGSLHALQEGNGPRTVLDLLPVQAIASRAVEPPDRGGSSDGPPTTRPLLLNKTGSTSGFAAYVAMVPRRQIGLVMLANRNFPTTDRVAAAHRVLTSLGALG